MFCGFSSDRSIGRVVSDSATFDMTRRPESTEGRRVGPDPGRLGARDPSFKGAEGERERDSGRETETERERERENYLRFCDGDGDAGGRREERGSGREREIRSDLSPPQRL